ncbi:retention module-containing protein [Kluyvera sp. CHPC 1.251]|uniref:retention module-containing protein n=1 Tax=Kluyvera sp. CHPC 1.251 TaxID=2995175 RepID=UPI002FD87960
MSGALGVIKAVIGQVFAVAADGSKRLLQEGDRVYSGEEIVTGNTGAVSIGLTNGKTVDIGRNSHWTEHGIHIAENVEHSMQDVAAMQKALADGADPTTALEATAAGNEPEVKMEGGGGGHTLVQLELTNEMVDPTAGFNTKGIGAPTWERELPEGALGSDHGAHILPPQVSITTFAGDDGFINKTEINNTDIEGTSNQTSVRLLFTDSQKNTLIVDVPVENGHWTTHPDLSSLAEGEILVVATATDVAGRTAQSSTSALIDTIAGHDDITVDSVTPDNVINFEESQHHQTLIRGNVSGDAKVGDNVTLTVDGHTYTDVVVDLGGGKLGYQIQVDTQDLLDSPLIHATVTSIDEAGNVNQDFIDHRVDIDLYAHNDVTIATVDGDNIVNTAESRMPMLISGDVGGDAKAGDPVTVTIDGHEYYGVVTNDNNQLRYSVTVPTSVLNEGENALTVKVVSHDPAGNEAIAIEHQVITLDTTAHSELTINTVAGDNVVNLTESRMPSMIGGEVMGDAHAGDRVVLTVNNQQFYGSVVDENGKLTYEVPVPTTMQVNGKTVPVLFEGHNDVQVEITSVDSSGNTTIAIENKTFTLDTEAHNALTIDTVANDNVVNAIEHRMPTVITGEVSGDAQVGDSVVVTVNGQVFHGSVVLDNGHLGYSVTVPAPTLLEGRNGVEVMVISHDAAGNEAIAVEHKTVTLDTHAENTVDIRTVAGDDVVNADESRHDTLITGAVGGKDAHAGDKVVVTVQGQYFNGEVVDNGGGHLHYRVAVPSGVLLEGNNAVQVQVISHDKAGNEAIAVDHRNVVLDTTANASITVNAVTHDNVLNHDELDGKQWVTGTVGGDARPNDPVELIINGKSYSGNVEVLHDGSLGYKIQVPAGAFGDNSGTVNADLRFTASVTAHDKAGNEVVQTMEHTVHLDNTAYNAVDIRTVSGDNIVNHDESQHETLINGVVSGKDARVGDKVVVEVQGHIITGRVFDDGHGNLHYKVAVPTGVLKEGNNDVQVQVYSHDKAGNEAVAEAHHNVVLDTAAHADITVNAVTPDNVLNHDELDGKQWVTGTVGGDARPNDPVELIINGKSYSGNVEVLHDGSLGYKIQVPAGAFGDNSGAVDRDLRFTASVTAHDKVGNEVVQTTEHTVHLDNTAYNAVDIHTVSGDNMVNHDESQQLTHITGAVSGPDAKVGDKVVVSVHGHDFYGRVVETGGGHLHYDVAIDSSLLTEGGNDVQVKVTSHDIPGNIVVSEAHHNVVLDTAAQASITVNAVTYDNILNHDELDGKLWVTGTVGGDASPNDPVDIIIQGHTYTGSVEELPDGSLGYNIQVPAGAFGDNSGTVNADLTFTARITAHDKAGNEVVQTKDHIVHLDNTAYNAVDIRTVSGDNIVNHDESQHETHITGAVSGKDAKAGDKVVVSVHGHDFYGQVVETGGGHLHYDVAIATTALTEGDNDVQVKVISHDKPGNEAVAEAHHNVTLDTAAHASITIDSVTADNVLNHDELAERKQVISGTVGGDAKVGDEVTLEINGHQFTGNVVDLGNNHLGYHIKVDSSTFSDNVGRIDKDVSFTAKVVSHDAVHNEVVASTTHKLHIDNHAEATITLDKVTGDDIINYNESGERLTRVSGTVGGEDVHLGDRVVVMVGGHNYAATVEALPHQNGALGYHVDVLTSDIISDPNHTVRVRIDGVDHVGNDQSAIASKDLAIDLKAEATITIDPLTANHDNMINADESKNQTTTITGTVGGDAKEGDIVTLHVNGFDLTGRVDAHLHYSIDVSTHDLMSDPHLTASITVTDNANNVATATAKQDIVVDTKVDAVITVDSVTDDNTLNGEELNHRYSLVSGTVTGEMKIGDPLTLTINHQVYQGKVEDLGNGKMGYRILVQTTDIHAGDHNIHASISVTDAAKNSAEATADHHVNIVEHANAGVTINIVSGDDVLNGADLNKPTTTINGVVSGDVKAGDYVHLTVNGHTYDVEVKAQPHLDGKLGYSFEADTSDLANDTHIVATVDVTDAAGNSMTAGTTHDIAIDRSAWATITVDPVTADNVINNDEAHQQYTAVTGQIYGDVQPGDKVELVVNGQHYYGAMHNDGSYSINVSTADLLSGSNQPIISASVMGVDKAGNTTLAVIDHMVNIDTRAEGSITADLTPNNPLYPNNPDYYIVRGDVGGDAKVGDLVKIFVGDKTLETHVQVVGDHLGYVLESYQEPGSKYPFYLDKQYVQQHPDITVQITCTDPHGNIVTVEDHLHANIPGVVTPPDNPTGTTGTPVDHTPPHATVTISPVAGDNVINTQESQSPETIVRGTVSGDVHPGEAVTLHIGKDTYTGTIIERPNLPGEYGYEIKVPTQSLIDHPDITATVIAHNANGSQEVSASNPLVIDTHVQASITLDAVAGDDIINIVESQSGTTPVSGVVSGDNIHAGSNVTLVVNGHEITTQVFEDANHILRFSEKVSIDDLRQDHNIIAKVTGSDDHGNTTTVTDSKPIVVDTVVNATVTIDDVTDHNVLNRAETKTATTAVTGSVTGDVKPGEYVTLTVNDHKYHAKVDQNLHYKVDVKTADIVANPTITAHVLGHDDAQNQLDAFDHKTVGIDTKAEGEIAVNVISGDNILSAADIGNAQTEISGTVGKDARVGDEVSVTLNHVTTTVHVIELPNMNGQLGYSMKVNTADLVAELDAVKNAHPTLTPEITVTVTGSDDVGNPFSQSATQHVTIDNHADVQLNLNPVSTDNVLNLDEAGHPMTEISGSVTGDVIAGNNVIVHVNGNDLVVPLVKDANGALTFSVSVNTAELLQDPKITYTVNGEDAVGNKVTVTESNKLVIDQHAENHIAINVVAGDDKVNSEEQMKGTTNITGPVSGDVHAGDIVKLEVNGHQYTGTVEEVGKKHHLGYIISVDTHDLNEGSNTVNVSVTGKDDAGNVASSTATHTFVMDTHADATINMDVVAGDNIINAKESKQLSVTGAITYEAGATLGDKVTLDINNHQIQTDVKMVNGHPSYDVKIPKSWLNEGTNDIKVSVDVTDQADNHATATHTQNVFVDTKIDASITIDPVVVHHVVNSTDPDSILVTGSVGKDVQVGDTVTLNVNNHPVTEHVKMINGHLGYEMNIEKSWLHEGSNVLKVSVTTEDAAHNHITVYHSEKILLDTQADAKIHIDNLSSDKHATLHDIDHHTVHITGEAMGEVHKGEHVDVTLNGKHYDAALHETDGHLRYDIPINAGDLHIGSNVGEIMVQARDEHGNVAPIIQPLNVMLSAPGHGGAQQYSISELQQDGKHAKGLHNLLSNGHDSLNMSYDHDKKGDDAHRQDPASVKGHANHGQADLSSLLHELHDKGDITQLIKGTDDHQGSHTAPAASVPAAHDAHSSPIYSLDHLIAKPDHYSH